MNGCQSVQGLCAVLLFAKYVSDKYAGQPYAEITVPEGASFADMVALKGNKEIGDRINKQILEPLEKANHFPKFADFNDEAKLDKGKDMIERLTNLITILRDWIFRGIGRMGMTFWEMPIHI